MMTVWLILFITVGIGSTTAEDLRLVDLPPEEAQQYIDGKDQSLKYAPKIESNVPAVRVLGKTPTNVLEDIYLANQYHGQDGLGSYLYGYSVPDIAKTEKKKAHGDLRGEYQYVNGGGQEIKVQYWDDGTGFHQVDNLPEILPKQVEDSPDVQAAKEEFFKRWHEEAERNSRPDGAPGAVPAQPQPQYQQSYTPSGPQSGQPFPGQQQGSYGASSSQQSSYQPAPNQGQGQTSQSGGYGGFQPGQVQAGQSASGQFESQPAGAYAGSGGGYQHGQQNPGAVADSSGQYGSGQAGKEWEYKPTEEEKGPPRGFFYNVDYPVGIIVQKQGEAGGVHKRESLENVYAQNKANFEEQVKKGASLDGSSQTGYQVHA